MRAKQCPHCSQTISLGLLKSSGHHKAFIKRQVFACPNCDTPIQLPQKAERVLSIGILCSLILAPLSYYFIATPMVSYLLFSNGAILILIGSFTNKLTLAKHQSKNKIEKDGINEALEDEIKETKKEKDNNE